MLGSAGRQVRRPAGLELRRLALGGLGPNTMQAMAVVVAAAGRVRAARMEPRREDQEAITVAAAAGLVVVALVLEAA